MADDSFLPPVVVTVLFDDRKALAEQDAYKDKLSAMADESDASMSGMGAGAAAAGDAHEDLADSAALGAAGVTAGAEDIKDAEDDVEKHSEGFSGKISKIFESIGTSMGNVGLPGAEGFKKAGEEIESDAEKGKGLSSSLEHVGKVATVAGAAAVAAFGIESVKAAIKAESANASLEASVKATGQSYSSVKPQIAKTEAQMEKYGYTGIETSEALTKLIPATKSTSKATEVMGLVANVAAKNHEALGEAANQVAKMFGGSNRLLTKYGLNVLAGSSKLTTLQTATQGVEKAQTSLQGVEAEVAAGKLSGAAAEIKLKAAHEALSAAILKQKQDQEGLKTVLGAVSKAVEGQASKAAETLAGKMKVLHANIEHLEVAFGSMLIPVLKAVAGVFVTVVDWFVKGGIAAKFLAGIVMGPLVLAIGFYLKGLAEASAKQIASFAKGAASAAKWAAEQITSWTGAGDAATAGAAEQSAAADAAAADVTAASAEQSMALEEVGVAADEAGTMSLAGGAMMAAGIALGTAGIALLVIGIIELVKHWHAVWDTIKAVLGDAVSFIKDHIMLIIEIMFPIVGVVKEIAEHWKQGWDDVKKVVASGVTDINHFFSSLWNTITTMADNTIHAIVNFFEGLPEKIWNFMKSIPGKFLKLGEELVNKLVDGVEHAPADLGKAIGKLAKKIPVIGGLIPELAEGGIVSKPTLSVIGEAGPEAVIPLKNLSHDGIKGLSMSQITGAVQVANAQSEKSGGGLKIEGGLNVYGTNASPNQLAQELYLKLRPMLQQV